MLLHRLPPFNLVDLQRARPQRPGLHRAAPKLLGDYPLSVITDGQGLNITVVGYLGQLHFGLVGLP